jgi:glutathione synthase/RimK-type ligase-like ATP-grasp enzyme
MITIKLLKITENEHEELDEFFEETDRIKLDQVAPQVVDGDTDIKVGDKSIAEYDACFTEIPPKNAVFGRVMLEMIEEKNVRANQFSTAFYIMAKKNYLYYILHEKEIPAPKTAVIATEKAARNIEKELETPVIARKLEELEETERKKLETEEEIYGFAEGSEYEEDVLIFQEYSEQEKYKCLVIGEQVISLKDSSEGWKIKEDNLKYSNLSDTQKEIVKQTAKKIGTSFAEIHLRGEQVYDLNPNPDIELFEQNAGRNVYEAVAEILKEE